MYSRDEIKALTDTVLNIAKADAVEMTFDAASARPRGPTPRAWSSTISSSRSACATARSKAPRPLASSTTSR